MVCKLMMFFSLGKRNECQLQKTINSWHFHLWASAASAPGHNSPLLFIYSSYTSYLNQVKLFQMCGNRWCSVRCPPESALFHLASFCTVSPSRKESFSCLCFVFSQRARSDPADPRRRTVLDMNKQKMKTQIKRNFLLLASLLQKE